MSKRCSLAARTDRIWPFLSLAAIVCCRYDLLVGIRSRAFLLDTYGKRGGEPMICFVSFSLSRVVFSRNLRLENRVFISLS